MSNSTTNETAVAACDTLCQTRANIVKYLELFSFVLAAMILPYVVRVCLHTVLYPIYQRKHLPSHSSTVHVRFPPDIRTLVILSQFASILLVVLVARDYFDLTTLILLEIGVPVILVLGWISQGMISDELTRRKFERMLVFDGPMYRFSARDVNIVMKGMVLDITTGCIHLWSEEDGHVVLPLGLGKECAIVRLPDE